MDGRAIVSITVLQKSVVQACADLLHLPNRPKLGGANSSNPTRNMSYFPEIPVIAYEGTSSDNPLAFRHYNASEKVGNKPWPSICALQPPTGT